MNVKTKNRVIVKNSIRKNLRNYASRTMLRSIAERHATFALLEMLLRMNVKTKNRVIVKNSIRKNLRNYAPRTKMLRSIAERHATFALLEMLLRNLVKILIGKEMVPVMMEITMKDVNTMEEIVVDQMSILTFVVNVNV